MRSQYDGGATMMLAEIQARLETRHVLRYLHQKIVVQDDEVEFDTLENEQWHCLEPLSFDLTRRKASARKPIWLGKLRASRKPRNVLRLSAPGELSSITGNRVDKP